jgi:hypothetical protein
MIFFAWRQFDTKADVHYSTLAGPPKALAEPRPRFMTTAPLQNRGDRLQADPRVRATTVAAGGTPVKFSRIVNPPRNRLIAEMKKGMVFGTEKTVNQFSGINRKIVEFSNVWAEHVTRYTRLLPQSSPPIDAANPGPVARPASQFTNTEDYAFFSLISIINIHLYTRIFQPFHPAATPQQNSLFEQGYQRQIQTGIFNPSRSA